MSTVSLHETKRKNFVEQATLLFSFLCDEFGYSGPVHSFQQQPNGVVIADNLQYDNEDIDRRIILENAYHPVDYGFELQFYRPSVSTRHADRFLAYYVLKEEQDVEQSYLPGVAALAKDKYRRVIDGEEWPPGTTLPTSDDIFEKVRERLVARLVPLGFTIAAGERNGAFGSHYVDLVRGSQAVRFIWDGKEHWFCLQQTPTYDAGPQARWSDVVLCRFDHRTATHQDIEQARRTLSSSVDSVSAYFQGA